MSADRPWTARFICARRTVSRAFSWPKIDSSSLGERLWRSTKRAECTNMPPEPHAGSKIRPWNGSMTSTMSRTIDAGVKNSPPFCPSVDSELTRGSTRR